MTSLDLEGTVVPCDGVSVPNCGCGHVSAANKSQQYTQQDAADATINDPLACLDEGLKGVAMTAAITAAEAIEALRTQAGALVESEFATAIRELAKDFDEAAVSRLSVFSRKAEERAPAPVADKSLQCDC